MSNRVTMREIIDNASTVSSMRWSFYYMVLLGVLLTALSFGAVLWNSFQDTEHQINIGYLISITGLVYGSAYGGKVTQSFSKNDTLVVKDNVETTTTGTTATTTATTTTPGPAEPLSK